MIRPVTFEFFPVSTDPNDDDGPIRSRLPAKSGVFRIFDVHGNLILLDKTFHLAQRIERFFVGDHDSRDLDLREITDRVEYRPTDSGFETLYLLHCERRRWFPSTYRKMKTFPLVRLLEIDPGLRFPRMEIVRRALPGRWTFGPFRSKSDLEKLKSDLERTFRLRPCEYDIQGDDPYPDCIYFQMRTCSKPCNGDIDREAYLRDIAQSAAIIEGDDARVLAELQESIESLSEELRFEEAAAVQKRIERIAEVRRSHKQHHTRVDRFHAVVILDSGSVKTRRVAHVRSGEIRKIEEHDVGTLGETLAESIAAFKDQSGRDETGVTPAESAYEDFCLVARFMTRPVGSVHVVPYSDDDPEQVVRDADRWIEGQNRKKRASTDTDAD